MAYYKDHTAIIEGSCSIYRINRSNSRGWWYVYITIRGEKRVRRSLKTTSKRDAIRLATTLYYKLRALKEEGLPVGDTSWNELVRRYEASVNFGATTGHRIAMLTIYFGKHANIKEITATDITTWDRWRRTFWTSKAGAKYRKERGIKGGRCLTEDVSETTIRMEATALKGLLTFAKDRGLIAHLPDICTLRSMRRYRSRMMKHRRAAFTQKEHQRIMRFLNHRYAYLQKAKNERTTGYFHAKAQGREYQSFPILKNRRMWLWAHLLRQSGLRPQEAVRLTWKDIDTRYDVENDVDVLEITVGEHASKTGAQRLVYVIDYGTVVNKEGTLKGALDLWRDITPYSEDTDLIFCNVNVMGQRDKLADMSRYFCRMIKKQFGHGFAENFAPIVKDADGKEYSSYSYRHMWATEKLMQGVNIYYVAEMMGTSVKQIRDHYGHVLSWDLKDEFYDRQVEHNERRKRQRARVVVELSKAGRAS